MATKAQVNVSNVVFSPGSTTGGTQITRVSTFTVDYGVNLIAFAGDQDQVNTVIALGMYDPKFTITTADVGTSFTFTPGSEGTLTAQMNDAKGVTGGAVLFTVNQANWGGANASASHAQFASANMNWQARSLDGATNPMVISRV